MSGGVALPGRIGGALGFGCVLGGSVWEEWAVREAPVTSAASGLKVKGRNLKWTPTSTIT
jgi:hypothetical protein